MLQRVAVGDQKQNTHAIRSDIVIILIRFFCEKTHKQAWDKLGEKKVYQQVAELRSTRLEYFKLDELLTA